MGSALWSRRRTSLRITHTHTKTVHGPLSLIVSAFEKNGALNKCLWKRPPADQMIIESRDHVQPTFPQSPESAPLWLFRRLPTHTHTKREIRKTPLILGGHRWLFFFSSSIHPSVDIMRWEPFSIHFSAFLWRVFSQCSFFCCPDREVKNRLANRTGEKSGDESIVFQLNTWAIWRKWEKKIFERYSISSSVWWCGKRFFGRVAPLPSPNSSVDIHADEMRLPVWNGLMTTLVVVVVFFFKGIFFIFSSGDTHASCSDNVFFIIIPGLMEKRRERERERNKRWCSTRRRS